MAARRDLAQHLGQILPFNLEPALVVLSYVISLVGAASTLELINRRTSRRGYYNNLLLFGASITMGGVAIWSMHYIGNRATIMLDGEPELQISYSAGFTVASFFLPIIVLLVAFFVVTGTTTSRSKISWWRVGVWGLLSGGAISGMHYLGNTSISNYRCDYVPSFVAGSVVIAVVASTVALALFFVFRSAWTNSWWKRIGCAVVLAGAVSGMHWCAVMGTRFTLMRVNLNADTSSRNTTVIVTACLSFAACLIMAGLAIYQARVHKGYANRAHRIALAAAVFDERGRVLVTPDGFLPSEVVTSKFLHKMKLHLARLPHHGRSMRTGIDLVDSEGHVIDDYDTIFCELFCVAASALANQMHETLVDVGVLWDEILATGGHSVADSISQTSTPTRSRGSLQRIKHDLSDMVEKGVAANIRGGHGHLMFLVRRVDSGHVDHLAAAGYCFAEPRQVAHIIRSKMQIRTAKVEEKLRDMERYACGAMLKPGIHVGLFAVRTQVHQSGFDVLVRRLARNMLPSVQLPLDRLEPGHTEFLRRLDGMSIGALLRRLEHANELPPRDAHFAGLLLDALRNLRTSVQHPVFDSAKLATKVSQVPCSPPAHETRPSTCSLIAFTIMIPIHIRVDSPTYEFIPLPFFKTQQLVYQNSPHNAAFARSVHRSIAPVLDSASPPGSALPPSSRLRELVTMPRVLRFPRSGRLSALAAHPPSQLRPRRGDAVRLVSLSREHMALTPSGGGSVSSLPLYGGEPPDHAAAAAAADREPQAPSEVSSTDSAPQQQHPTKMSFGGIMVSQEITVDVEDAAAAEPVHDDMPEMPAAAHHRQDSFGSGDGAHVLARHQSQGERAGAQGGAGGGGQNPPPRYERAIELREVSTAMCPGVSKVVVNKEGDDAVETFVDDLFSVCINVPRRM
ncbi:uncharacterized protein THITE_2144801 [Thermothielavioides terrestris NRRL 8126]|uniref:MHYT domain-containing protein n=1 Tax=Thermothielavioides terrestris (strain ATCC 38088 / NRRL 8126) TaxID=578455 RepID=G2R8L5_THETT|nr:uncharacterized protein THITE_2144801 [Thermothielavioides terrestris NRRL 8126]AEO67430.1 hypothetical protein THITE_2144801 [Thermothielavioides terrestris NRRL 8126]